MKRDQNRKIQAALAMAAAAFVSIPSAVTGAETGTRFGARRRCSPAQPRFSGGPYIAAGARTNVRIGAWRPPQGSSCDAEVTVQIFDVENNQVLDSTQVRLADGKGTLISADVPSGTLFVVQAEYGPAPIISKFLELDPCKETFPLKVTIQVSNDGDTAYSEVYEGWPAKWYQPSQGGDN